MDVGIYTDSHLGIGETARAVEEAGFSHLWAYDSPLVYADPYMALLEAARTTTRLVVGPGVTNPRSRSAIATAQALGTLAVAAPGRVAFGLGVGSSARFSLGMEPATLAETHAFAEAVRGLLSGQTIDYREGGRSRRVRLIHRRGRWLDLSHPFELWVSAFGPRGQRLAGAYADGVYVRWEGAEKLAAVRRQIDEGALASARQPGSVKIGLLTSVYPVESEEELAEPEAQAALGPLAISRLRFLTTRFDDPAAVPEPFRAAFAEYLRRRQDLAAEEAHLDGYEGYLVEVPGRFRRFLSPELIGAVAFVGDADAVAGELRAMEAAGADQVGLQICGPPARWCARMKSSVLPAVAGKVHEKARSGDG
ncbi:MAG: LLM class flavin-dependent oxidoreductase [Actinobacteria bacterium]|nr:LLM class flavin-dependent oxidoreductase [Actinomycetota bacterium]